MSLWKASCYSEKQQREAKQHDGWELMWAMTCETQYERMPPKNLINCDSWLIHLLLECLDCSEVLIDIILSSESFRAARHPWVVDVCLVCETLSLVVAQLVAAISDTNKYERHLGHKVLSLDNVIIINGEKKNWRFALVIERLKRNKKELKKSDEPLELRGDVFLVRDFSSLEELPCSGNIAHSLALARHVGRTTSKTQLGLEGAAMKVKITNFGWVQQSTRTWLRLLDAREVCAAVTWITIEHFLKLQLIMPEGVPVVGLEITTLHELWWILNCLVLSEIAKLLPAAVHSVDAFARAQTLNNSGNPLQQASSGLLILLDQLVVILVGLQNGSDLLTSDFILQPDRNDRSNVHVNPHVAGECNKLAKKNSIRCSLSALCYSWFRSTLLNEANAL
jgi:hypothetical protein